MMRVVSLLLVVLLGGVGSGCRTSDDARVLQVLNQRGFGRPTLDANRQYYVGIGDSIAIRAPLYPEYNGVREPVRMDGVITLPDVGEVYVNGLTPQEITEVVRKRYDRLVTDTAGITAEVVGTQSKRYYVTGVPPRAPAAVAFTGDTLLIDALIRVQLDQALVDTEDILVIRGDPEAPLVIHCNWEDITQRGLTRDNIPIRENDLIYLTPSFIGWIAYGATLISAPVVPLRNAIFGASNLVTTFDTFGTQSGFGGRGRFGGFGGGGFGGGGFGGGGGFNNF